MAISALSNNFERCVLKQIEFLNAGQPLEAFDAYFSHDGVMFANDVVFASSADEARKKQEPFISAADSISGLITDLKTHLHSETCVFRNKTSFTSHDGQTHQIDGLCWQQWAQGKIAEERYYDGDAMLAIILTGVLLKPEQLALS